MNDHGPGSGMMMMAVEDESAAEHRKNDPLVRSIGVFRSLRDRYIGVGLPRPELLVAPERTRRGSGA